MTNTLTIYKYTTDIMTGSFCLIPIIAQCRPNGFFIYENNAEVGPLLFNVILNNNSMYSFSNNNFKKFYYKLKLNYELLEDVKLTELRNIKYHAKIIENKLGELLYEEK